MNKKEMLSVLNDYNLPKKEFVILAGAALVFYGIKEKTHDIDIVVSNSLQEALLKNYKVELEWHNSENNKDVYFIDNILNFSNNLNYIIDNKEYTIIDGYQVQTIESIIKLKQKFGREKDYKDIELIKKKMNLNNLNSLSLAYLGDSIYEVYIRTFLLEKGISKVNELQKEAIKYVSAKNQYEYLKEMLDSNFLSESEINIIMRARNHKSHKSPKNTDVQTYKYSTGLEALIGYLYLNDKERLDEIMNFILKK